jgi:ankyrin repeat protein
LLIEHGADVNAEDWLGFAPLHDSDSEGYIEIVKLLIKNFKNL